MLPFKNTFIIFLMFEKEDIDIQPSVGRLRFLVLGIVSWVLMASNNTLCVAQDEAWEYSPYRMQLWLSIDPSLSLTSEQKERLLNQVQVQTELIYNPAARVDATFTPRNLTSRILNELNLFSIQQVLLDELTLVITKNSTDGKDIRTFENVLEKSGTIIVTDSNAALIRREMEPYLQKDSWKPFSDLLKPINGTAEDLMNQIKKGEVITALVRRSELEKLGRNARMIPVRFPWQMDSLLRTRDKIFAVAVLNELESIRVQVREIDCAMRVVGPIVTTSTSSLEMVPRVIAYATQEAFAPMARIEEADLKTTKMRIRAGGLLTQPEQFDHPIRLVPGDVLVPYVRRDDRNGVPTLLQSLPWTYIAITAGDDKAADGAIYSGIRGALAGRKNKRTLKVGLKARPSADATNLQLNVSSQPSLRVAGAEVYRRAPGGEDLTLVSRTDWRGIIRLNEHTPPVALYEAPVTKKADASVATSDGSSSVTPASNPTATPPIDLQPVKSQIELKFPLYMYYIKNGNTLLAKLPIVTGLLPEEAADLPDDRRRLEAEAFIKGVQGEVLDLVARRQILAKRIRDFVEVKNKAEAEKLLNELRSMKSYDKMQEELDILQRRILSSDRGPITAGTQMRIDKMFDTTRQMLQKYLQDKLLRDLELAVRNLG
jgi:hypothetical protein